VGLDQYLFVEECADEEATEVFYWRKHPNLHGFMTAEWLSLPENEGKSPGDFNCQRLYITAEIVERLDACTRPNAQKGLPPTSGFFFGESDGYYDEQDRKAVEFMRGAVERGQRVYYDSWW